MRFPLTFYTGAMEGFRENPKAQYQIKDNTDDYDIDVRTNEEGAIWDWEITIPNRFAQYQLIQDLCKSVVKEIGGYLHHNTTPGDDSTDDYIPQMLEAALLLNAEDEYYDSDTIYNE